MCLHRKYAIINNQKWGYVQHKKNILVAGLNQEQLGMDHCLGDSRHKLVSCLSFEDTSLGYRSWQMVLSPNSSVMRSSTLSQAVVQFHPLGFNVSGLTLILSEGFSADSRKQNHPNIPQPRPGHGPRWGVEGVSTILRPSEIWTGPPAKGLISASRRSAGSSEKLVVSLCR
jgi:hypothetical protein